MPVTSRAQWRKFHAMFRRGEITKAQLDKWTKGVDFKRLPARKKKIKKKSKKSRTTRTARKRTRKR